MATQIKTFALSQLTIGSCSQFHSIVCRFIDTATPAALHIEALEPAYKSAAATLSSIVNRQAAFVATKEMKAADARRDSAAGTISSVVNAYAIVRPTEAITTFITDLNGIIKAYVSIIDGTASGGSAADGDGSTSDPTPEPGGDEGEGGSPL